MHPLQTFKYCPVCGSSHFEINTSKSKLCHACNFEYFLNPSSANVAVIINTKNEILVVRRAKEPAKGTLDLPGGFSDLNETLEEGMAREVKEETGLIPEKIHYLFSIPNQYEYSGFIIPTLDAFFLCYVKDFSNLRAMDDASEYLWLPLSKINPTLFGLKSIRKGIEKIFSLNI